MALTLEWYEGGTSQPVDDLAYELDIVARIKRDHAVLFTYEWSSRTLVLGYSQSPEELDLQRCCDLDIPVLKRRSGGTSVLHEHSLNVAIALPSSHPWASGIHELYDAAIPVIQYALADSGVSTSRPARQSNSNSSQDGFICFEARHRDSLLVDKRKVAGGAQIRKKHAVLLHITLPLMMTPNLQAEVFGVSSSRIDAAMTALPHLDADYFTEQLARELATTLHTNFPTKRSRPTFRPSFLHDSYSHDFIVFDPDDSDPRRPESTSDKDAQSMTTHSAIGR